MDYFKHDINAGEDDKICDLLAEGGYELLGYYWRFIEYLYGRGGKMRKDKLNGVAWLLHMEVDKLSQVICNYGLFMEEEGYIYSERVVREIGDFEAIGKRMAEIGRSGGQASAQAKTKRTVKRALSECLSESQAHGCDEPSVCSTKENKIKENKIKEKKESVRARANLSFSNIDLSPDELSDLQRRFPDWETRLEHLSLYMQKTGKTYNSHYATILDWAEQDKKKAEEAKAKETKVVSRPTQLQFCNDRVYDEEFFKQFLPNSSG